MIILCISFCIMIFCSTCNNVHKDSDMVTQVRLNENVDSNVVRRNIDTMACDEIIDIDNKMTATASGFDYKGEYSLFNMYSECDYFALSEDFFSYYKEYVKKSKRKGGNIDSVKKDLLRIMDMREDSIDKWWRDTP